jgi:hypothetical protein
MPEIHTSTLKLIASFLILGTLGACSTNTRPLEISPAETGVMARVEAGTIVSTTPVTISGMNRPSFSFGRKRANGNGARGLTIVLRVERNNEMVSVTQGDDVPFKAGDPVWLQYGDRVRVIPR